MKIIIQESMTPPSYATVIFNLTARQIEALTAAHEHGGAIYVKGSRRGGGLVRMCARLAEQGLVADRPPYPITDRGREVLSAIAKAEGR